MADEQTAATISARPPPGDPAPRHALTPTPATVPWTAEIEWRGQGGTTRFCALAVDAAGDRRVLAESARVPWPPTGADSLAALTGAVAELEQRLIAGGWMALPASGAWYAKRFAWEPAAETEPVWRCEIRWIAGRLTTGFEAVASGPGGERPVPVAASTAHRWRLGSAPDPDAAAHHARVRELAASLEAAGWERAGQGDEWYCQRFLWRGEQPPALAGGAA
jgi:hypothetical protein